MAKTEVSSRAKLILEQCWRKGFTPMHAGSFLVTRGVVPQITIEQVWSAYADFEVEKAIANAQAYARQMEAFRKPHD